MREEHQEVRRRHGPSRLEKLKWHFGAVVAGALAVMIGLQIGKVILRPPGDATQALRDLRDATSRIRTNVAGREFALEARMSEVDAEVARLRTTFKHVVAPVEPQAGITYPASYLKTLKPGESNEIRFAAPIGLAATAEAGGVDLKWAEAAENNVKVGAFEVHRAEAGAEPALLQKVDGATHAFRDSAALPGHTYQYTVQAVAQDEDLVHTPRGRSPHSAPASVKAVADFKIELVDVAADGITMKVSKWHEGSWRDRRFDLKEGDPIGKADQALGIDFSTGRTVTKVEIEATEVPVTRNEVVFDGKGRVVIEGGAAKRVPVASTATRRKTSVFISGGGLPDETLVSDEN